MGATVETGGFDTAADPRSTVTNAQVSLFLVWVGFIASFCWFKIKPESRNTEIETDVENDTRSKKGASEKHSAIDIARCGIIFGGILFYMWLLDDQQVLHIRNKSYNRDIFLFILAGILLWATSTRKEDKRAGILSRDQTEEWKGWMQIIFLLYHYFAAKEYYNLIRILIASYVWMTGYGNISYFIKTKDYSIWRVFKMLFRLNFLVLFICLTMNTEYMLYYICPMHTLWFLSVWMMMAVKPDWNEDSKLLGVKLAIYASVVAVVWEIPAVFKSVWAPLRWLLETNNDGMHEWQFRTTLDHWATFAGMLCGLTYPMTVRRLAELETSSREYAVKFVLGTIVVGVLYLWYTSIFVMPKFEYNALHPYFSIIPILAYIFFRNISTTFRAKNMDLLVQCGKITLETYLCQFHMWMCRKNNTYVAGLVSMLDNYPLLNFMLVSILYIIISQNLFDLTSFFSGILLPKLNEDKDWTDIRRRWGMVFGSWTVLYTVVVLVRGAEVLGSHKAQAGFEN